MALRDEAWDLDPGGIALTAERSAIEAAVELVAAGCATRVALTGLREVDVLIAGAKRFGGSRHVRVRRLRPSGDGPVALVVEAAPIRAAR
jgi:hypothetical protein